MNSLVDANYTDSEEEEINASPDSKTKDDERDFDSKILTPNLTNDRTDFIRKQKACMATLKQILRITCKY